MPVTSQIKASGEHHCSIPFEDDMCSLSKKYLLKQISHLPDFNEFRLGNLKFLSFQEVVLTLLKNGIGIRSFNIYLDGLQEAYKPLYSKTQDTLNTACLNLWQEIKKLPEDICLNLSKQASLAEIQLIYTHWQQLNPYLLVQPHIYWTKYYRERYLKMKPVKNRCYACTIAAETPSFRFILKDMGTYFRLYLEAIVNDLTINEFVADPYFFITHQTTFYLLGSLRDVAITHWIEKSGGYITIFKPHFVAFEKEILDTLRQHYPVLLNSRTKKITSGK